MNNENNIDILARLKVHHLVRRYVHLYDKNEDSKLLL